MRQLPAARARWVITWMASQLPSHHVAARKDFGASGCQGLGEGSGQTKIDYRQKGTLILTSLVEDLVNMVGFPCFLHGMLSSASFWEAKIHAGMVRAAQLRHGGGGGHPLGLSQGGGAQNV